MRGLKVGRSGVSLSGQSWYSDISNTEGAAAQNHFLIVSTRIVPCFDTLSEEEEKDMLEGAFSVGTKFFVENKFSVFINDGYLGAQTVPHCHVHVTDAYDNLKIVFDAVRGIYAHPERAVPKFRATVQGESKNLLSSLRKVRSCIRRQFDGDLGFSVYGTLSANSGGRGIFVVEGWDSDRPSTLSLTNMMRFVNRMRETPYSQIIGKPFSHFSCI